MSSSTTKNTTRKPNRGSFRPGPDACLYTFTTDERRRGYQVAMYERDWDTASYVFRKVRGHFRAKRRAASA